MMADSHNEDVKSGALSDGWRGERKTQERIAHMLKTGKPLRDQTRNRSLRVA
jgi:hypothetical protein